MTLSTPLLAAAPLLAGLIGPALLGAAPGRQPADLPDHRAMRHEIVEHVAARTDADQRRVLDYWTPERMAKALPIDLLDTVTDGAGVLSGLTGRTEVGTAPDVSSRRLTPRAGGVTTGVAGDGLAGSLWGRTPRHQAAAARWDQGDQGATARRPQTNTAGSRWITGGAVARTTGRVFLTVRGADFVCSASTVRSANRDVVVTAGHCVKDGAGGWAANWTFVPAYGMGGAQRFGQYAARRMFVAGPWSRSGDDNYDVGMVALATSGGRHVADVVGTQEIAFNPPRGGQVFGFGYPADPPYDGHHLVYCAGRLRADPYGQSRDQGLGCEMTAGSSGGPWLTTFDLATGKGTITSVSSFKYSDDQRTMYGPYFGDATKALFDTAEHA
ncbi:trypsin-like serine peptidase [Nonomuraea angiospora]|uniref:trypsin-like serine peptidase n=1 Tax=Nonomuraea angiospora TaxID=46172 RepID=UPI0029B868DB|nr:trypsin-like serine protease [Nonomuraea angiospora]MDX3105285.1 trypsin-like serine protease [Nonomuraea angiospora]